MAIFVLSDTHLAIQHADKSMEVFGSRWQNYVERIETNWKRLVEPTDTVVIPGDISWALTLSDSIQDFAFLDQLPGTKLIGKGNHDFFWTTATKMNSFFAQNGWSTLKILYNNAYFCENTVICGTRGWFNDPKQQKVVGTVDYQKIVNREVLRLRFSLDCAVNVRNENDAPDAEIIPFLHFPPIWSEFHCDEMVDLLHTYGVRRCYFGHIHGVDSVPQVRREDGIDYILAAADFLRFTPLPVFPTDRYFGG